MKKWMILILVLALAMTAAACSCQKQPAPSGETTEATDNNQAKTLTGTMEENINKIVAENPAEFMGGVIPLDLKDTSEEGLWALKSYTGLDSAEKITDAAAYEPMTGSQAFSLVLVRVADPADTKEIAQQMKANIDPRKWICVSADQVLAAGYGDVVMFVMLNANLGKTAQSYVDAFEKLCGSKPDFTI
ncbi:MAG: hypothetical protein IJX37_09255 [Oscillospiraceae bacterium]|nr:hypothetical protein [Oscillospiraceae bacterium]